MVQAESLPSPSSDSEETSPKPRGIWLKKMKIAGALLAIVLVQCFVVYMYLPSGESAASASSKPEPTPPESAHHASAEREQTEIDLGAFSLTVFNPNSNNNLLVDFHLYGTVMGPSNESASEKKEDIEEDDAAKLEKLLKGHKHRFRDQVITTLRNAQITDLADPGLGLLKRQILAKTNALLGEPLLKEVIFSDFVIVEQ
ncbi:MAG TPA: flagellar basal body-associated FliL family protein [Pirellulales bacterium]|jgi:flagellar FliL protein|nr:flagellar basal body-associated FliL family protein [Pirellulales bacterium]